MKPITLYDYDLSGNCYKVRLLLSFLGLDYQSQVVEFYPAAEHRQPWFQKINPLCELPVLQDGELTLRESQAILIYLACQYDSHNVWYPRSNAAQLAQIAQWLAFAEGITASASRARLVEGFFFDFNIEECRTRAHALFRILDEHLWFAERRDQLWLVDGDHPTLADLACFPYVMLSEEGGISRQDYPAIRRWTDRFKRTPGFIVMPGIFPAGPAA